MNDRNITKVGSIELNRLPECGDQLTSKDYVDNLVRNSVDESTLLRLETDEKLNLDEQVSILLISTLTSLKVDI